MGKQLRPLLYKPRVGLPVFTEHKVRRLLRRAKNADGVRINCYVRPQHLPAHAPGAPYPEYVEDAYAEVPCGAKWQRCGDRGSAVGLEASCEA